MNKKKIIIISLCLVILVFILCAFLIQKNGKTKKNQQDILNLYNKKAEYVSMFLDECTMYLDNNSNIYIEIHEANENLKSEDINICKIANEKVNLKKQVILENYPLITSNSVIQEILKNIDDIDEKILQN